MEQMSKIQEQALLRTRNKPGQRPGKEPMLLEKMEEEESAIGKIVIGSMLSANYDSQIRMEENDEEKTGFHTEERVYYFTHTPKGLKNSATTLQRTMEKSSSRCRGNIEKTKEDEHLNQPERINIWSGRRKVSRVHNNEGGNKGRSRKIQAIVRSPTPKDLNQIRSLSLKLTAISKFIPKLAELMHPILEVRKALDATNGSGWTNKAKKAFQKIKRKLKKLQTLTIPKEG
ncbi:hypothetical protein Tco_0179667 [Tanacetum coccineum]